jgi:hypothetical protein
LVGDQTPDTQFLWVPTFDQETKTMNTQSITVPFHGSDLFVVEHEGQPYTAMKPIVQGMGLAWQPQLRKLIDNSERWGTTIMVLQVPGDDQSRGIACIPLRKLFGWLMSVHPKKVRPEIKDRIVMYQNECDDVLLSHWIKGGYARHDDVPVMPVANPFDDVEPALLRQLGKIGSGLPWAYLVSKGVTPSLVFDLLTQNSMARPVAQADMFVGEQA